MRLLEYCQSESKPEDDKNEEEEKKMLSILVQLHSIDLQNQVKVKEGGC